MLICFVAFFAVVVGVLMAVLFRRDEAERQRDGADPFAAAAAGSQRPREGWGPGDREFAALWHAVA